MEWNKELTLLKITDFLNDEVLNKPLNEIKDNLTFLLKLLNGNIYNRNNLLDYNKTGQKIINNSGLLDTKLKLNNFTAYKTSNEEIIVANDVELVLGTRLGGNQLCYVGEDNPSEYDSDADLKTWLERTIYIPQELRGKRLVFAMKCGVSSLTDFTTGEEIEDNTIGVSISNSVKEDTTTISVSEYDDYTHDKYCTIDTNFKQKTILIPFIPDADEESVTLNIWRNNATSNTYLHILKIYIGEFSGEHTYDPENKLDINDLFDFQNDLPYSNTVNGHKAYNENNSNKNANDLIPLYLIKDALESSGDYATFRDTIQEL